MTTFALPILAKATADIRRPPAFHVMIKPRGAVCNLACDYCFYLEKQSLFAEGASFRMSDEVLETFTRQYLTSQQVGEVTFGWQGGEPTLMGLDFFRRAVELQKRFAPAGMKINNAFQTNGILLDEAWCEFLGENNFLIGLSLDGPADLHDAFRRDRGGHATFDRVHKSLKLMQRTGVEANVLCVVNSRNGDHGGRVYRFFRDEGVQFIQFIPAVGRTRVPPPNDSSFRGTPRNRAGTVEGVDSSEYLGMTGATEDRAARDRSGGDLTPWSVRPTQWGHFLCSIFDIWVKTDVSRVFVQHFDQALAPAVGMEPSICVHARTCGTAVAMEHSGDVFSCDHFVTPEHLLGNIQDAEIADLVGSGFQRKFGQDKWDTLPAQCRSCEVLSACNGGCPKDRFTPDGVNYLCAGYKQFLLHTRPAMRQMAALLRAGRAPAEIMFGTPRPAPAGRGAPGRNDPCPCGSGKKFKKCCGRQ